VTETLLRNISLDYLTGLIDEKSALHKYKDVTERYATQLPIENIESAN